MKKMKKMKRNKIINLGLCLLVCISAVSCMKEKRENTYNAQESKIDQYVESNRFIKGPNGTDSLSVIYNGGATRLILTEGTGENLKANGTVSFYYAGYTFTGNKSVANLFATNHEETAVAAKWELTDADYQLVTMALAESDLIQGLSDGLTGVKSGEHCQILFSGKYGYGKKPFGTIPANSAVLFEIWVEAVSNE